MPPGPVAGTAGSSPSRPGSDIDLAAAGPIAGRTVPVPDTRDRLRTRQHAAFRELSGWGCWSLRRRVDAIGGVMARRTGRRRPASPRRRAGAGRGMRLPPPGRGGRVPGGTAGVSAPGGVEHDAAQAVRPDAGLWPARWAKAHPTKTRLLRGRAAQAPWSPLASAEALSP